MMRYAPIAPVEPGYYWLKEGDEEEIVEVWNDPNRAGKEQIYFIHRCGSGDAREVGSLKEVYWAGPIEQPEPAIARADALRVDPAGAASGLA